QPTLRGLGSALQNPTGKTLGVDSIGYPPPLQETLLLELKQGHFENWCMRLRSIETTPSPNCMKLNLDAPIGMKSLSLTADKNPTTAPEIFQKVLAIEGVQSLYATGDFITLTRKGSMEWQPILATAGNLIGIAPTADTSLAGQLQTNSPGQATAQTTEQTTGPATSPSQNFGQVEVAIQMFRGIPVQVRATSDSQQARVALPDRFNQALQRAIVTTGADYVAERIWSPYQPQFGQPHDIAQQVAEEVAILINDQDLAALEIAAVSPTPKTNTQTNKPAQDALLAGLQHSDWKQRLKAIQQIEVTPKTFPAIVTALQDERNGIRRWAAALLGASEQTKAIAPLCHVLRTDKSAIVRRTAGDALSDLGNIQATDAIIEALTDASGLVRWRAGRFLNELGTNAAIPALTKAAEAESEFDVRVELNAAIDRITAGKASQLPMWMRISQNN
ncbi:MAG: virulence factor, partial [Cyanobacteria bacterium J06555_13]